MINFNHFRLFTLIIVPLMPWWHWFCLSLSGTNMVYFDFKTQEKKGGVAAAADDLIYSFVSPLAEKGPFERRSTTKVLTRV